MKYLSTSLAFTFLALQAAADARLGVKACVVENARWFDPESGDSGSWADAQKSFILNVYTCEDVHMRGIDVAHFNGVVCKQPFPRVFAITTSIKGWEKSWGDAVGSVPTIINGEPSASMFDPVVAEFHSETFYLQNPNKPVLRLYPDLRFQFIQVSRTSDGKSTALWTLTGTCADIQ